MAKFSSFKLHQIPREENGEADCLAQLASSSDLKGEAKFMLLKVERKSIDEGEVQEICEKED